MNELSFNTPTGKATQVTNDAVRKAGHAIEATRRATNSAFDSLQASLDTLPAKVDRASTGVEDLARRSTEEMHRMRERAAEMGIVATDHVRASPWRSVMIAAAVGAGVVMLIDMLARSSHRSTHY